MASDQVQSTYVSTATIIKVVVVILAVFFLYLLKDVLFILFFAIMIASAVGPFANWMEHRRVPRLLSVLVLYLVFFGLFFFFLSLIIPLISYQLSQLTQALPRFVSNISSAIENAQQSGSAQYVGFLGEIQNVLSSFSQFLQISAQSILSLVIGIFGGALSFIAIVIISFYFSVMPHGVLSFFKSILPERYDAYIVSLWKRSEYKVGKWFQGQLLLALSVGLLVFVGLSLMHIKYALLLAILATILEIVPIAGPVISGFFGVLLAFVQEPSMGLWVLIFYIVVQQLEAHVFAPLILGKTLGLHPVTVIIALLIGGKLAGILGVVVAVPVAVIIVEILDDMAEQRESKRIAAT